VSITDDSLVIDFDSKFSWHREQIQEAENKKAIETELLGLTGKPMNLKIKANDSSHDVENSEQEAPISQRDMQRDASQDESVKLVIDVFDGRIVEVKP
jgi:hypothetical protein